MKLLELPNGKGQKVFIDRDWAKGCLERTLFIQNPEDAQQAYKNLIRHLIYHGYEIIFDEDFVTDDTFYLTPCSSTNFKEIEIKIKKLLEETPVKEPKTINFPEDSFPDIDNFMPFVLKNTSENGGKEKYVIRSIQQLNILKRFYREIDEIAFKKIMARAKEWYPFCFDENGNLKMEKRMNGEMEPALVIPHPNYQKFMHKNCIIQEYIETPTDYNTSLRVLISADGDVLCASLKYSRKDKKKSINEDGNLDPYLGNPRSKFYLGDESIVSNTVAGGNSILLGKGESEYSIEEREILAAHDIKPEQAEVPSEVLETAKAIIKSYQKNLGAISGMDFIYDAGKKKWLYLEEHAFPMLSSYAEAYSLPYCNPGNDEFRELQRTTDIDARLRALSLMIQKKQKPISPPKREKIF